MPTGICKGCGRMTNSTTSNWWMNKPDYEPTECYMAFKNDKPVQGCAYHKIPPEMGGAWYKKWIDDMISKNPWRDKKEPEEFEEGD